MIDYNYRHRNNPRHIPYNSQSKDSKGTSTTMNILNERYPDSANTSLTNMYHLRQDHNHRNPSLRAPTDAIPIKSPSQQSRPSPSHIHWDPSSIDISIWPDRSVFNPSYPFPDHHPYNDTRDSHWLGAIATYIEGDNHWL